MGFSTPFCRAHEAKPLAERGGLRRDLPLLRQERHLSPVPSCDLGEKKIFDFPPPQKNAVAIRAIELTVTVHSRERRSFDS